MAIDGKWNLVIKTPMGEQTGVLTLKQEGDALAGEMVAPAGTQVIENGRVDGDKLLWEVKVTTPMPLTLEFEGQEEGGNLNGNVKLGAFGSSTFSGTPA